MQEKHLNYAAEEPKERSWAAILVVPETDEALVPENLGSVEETMNVWYKMRQAYDIAEANQYAAQLYEKLFGRFEKRIQNIRTIFIAPDGFLNLLSFSRLVLSDGRYWTERQDLRRVQTGRDLIRKPDEINTGSLLAIGGADFDHWPESDEAAKTNSNSVSSFNYRTAMEFKHGFKPLPGSGQEVKKIARIYKTTRNVQPVIWTGNKACEAGTIIGCLKTAILPRLSERHA